MPAVASGKVLVTGANGFIAMWIIDRLLRQGYSVRAAVRTKDKGAHILHTFSAYADKVEIVGVGDISKEGAFDSAVVGVDGIVHTASPVHLHADDPDELIKPAVNGTLGVLQSVLAHGTSVKRIVITSSCAAVVTPGTVPRVFTERDWNEAAVREVQEKGRDASALAKYRASKTHAERAAWDFVERHKAEIGWDLVTIAPPYVFGPVLHAVSSPEYLNQSNVYWFNIVCQGTADSQTLTNSSQCWVDVRDLADAHYKALSVPEAGNERFIVCAGPFMWQDWVNTASAISKNIPPGDTSYDPTATVYLYRYDVSKTTRILGVTYRSMSETAHDILDDMRARGWRD